MTEWGEAILFGFTVLAFALGASSLIMGFLPQPAGEAGGIKSKVEYGFFGAAGLVIAVLLLVALTW